MKKGNNKFSIRAFGGQKKDIFRDPDGMDHKLLFANSGFHAIMCCVPAAGDKVFLGDGLNRKSTSKPAGNMVE